MNFRAIAQKNLMVHPNASGNPYNSELTQFDT